MIQFSNMQQSTPEFCVVDLTPPMGGEIISLANNSDGSLRAIWGIASDAAEPIHYEIYLKAGSSTDLFDLGNIVAISKGLLSDIFHDQLGGPIVKGETYFAGVRAVDAFGNRSANLVSVSVVALGLDYSNLLRALQLGGQLSKVKVINQDQQIKINMIQPKLKIEIRE